VTQDETEYKSPREKTHQKPVVQHTTTMAKDLKKSVRYLRTLESVGGKLDRLFVAVFALSAVVYVIEYVTRQDTFLFAAKVSLLVTIILPLVLIISLLLQLRVKKALKAHIEELEKQKVERGS